MKLAVMLARDGDPRSAARYARSLEEAGVDVLAVPEAYGFDAVSWLGYLAAVTDRAELMSQILPIYGRTPVAGPRRGDRRVRPLGRRNRRLAK
jgi:alkanesulfonate monooxygenase SsuD/methylene tetrahydromethanopterin reductase-like flavin-dependent oxidoreductase (luciferase family)